MPIHKRWSEESIPAVQRPSWPILLAEQRGIVNTSQLRAYGHSTADIEANLEAGRWQRVLPRVYATFTGELSRSAKIHAALRYGGGHAILSHRTAAEEWGLLPIIEGPVEITVPYTFSAVSCPPLVIVHRSRALPHIAVGTTPRRSRLTDTIVDLATSQRTPKMATNTVVDLVSRSKVSLAAMEKCVFLRPPYRYRPAIRYGLALLAGGLMSALEVEYKEAVEDEHGLPQGSRQTPFEVKGKILWEDVTYDPHGAAVTVRLDGRATHAMADVAFRDRKRDNAAELAGRARLVYGWNDVRTAPCEVAAEVRAVLVREGWDPAGGRAATCPRCGK
ncbi:hypothetical protein [Amycolatopsis regifaucium]|uniref:Transcriptional regulator, AbiEi antitoxin, Type IV TA system n=1 Tax=Amycolatopsis regifaucium TaxID=546365 RepID=A0A154MBJ0_9PSEU|nr:hypothetical protein [Amycolatopsis regifaucium]KZB81955.1 hypothetical protein AVL48_08315 [Amycolatopsis regifaucium]OKA05974.1 hypothetical protein ATP06_0222680 [Amycolatopsis regifaucium]SFG77673.1 Transcriptional regulator, AbiEi antitoxin, Type IV TA system [Amycolatopsis regifaucium]